MSATSTPSPEGADRMVPEELIRELNLVVEIIRLKYPSREQYTVQEAIREAITNWIDAEEESFGTPREFPEEAREEE